MNAANSGKGSKGRILLAVLVCLTLVGSGVAGMRILASGKTSPPVKERSERVLPVEIAAVRLKKVQLAITGYGEIRSLNQVEIAPEVDGRVVYIHPHLEIGEIIPKNETLFKIDTIDYRIEYDAAVKRLEILRRNRELASREYQRLKKLHQIRRLVALAKVEKAEMALNSVDDAIGELERRLEIARTGLNRCEIKAPFVGRIKKVRLEKGQYVTAGTSVMTLVDDALLEIHLPLNSVEAAKLLRFKPTISHPQLAWFNALERVPCPVTWTEGGKNVRGMGILHRVVRYEPTTRTLHVAVRIDGSNSRHQSKQGLNLAEGMFCKVEIPGRKLKNMMEIPITALNYNNTVRLAVGNRLKTVPVTVEKRDGDIALVSSGLKQNDLVVTTRLVGVLENTLLRIPPQTDVSLARHHRLDN
ncbi:MAG: efflux RND transporter periplasmic adaptor subunit [Proteobacteria bacterium]|nr:efflux RND transporter periplasmic adaptor subunit [Pseudomonadota bacterium]